MIDWSRDRADELDLCFQGKRLHGDDFTPSEIEAWFEDEEDGYYELGAHDRSAYQYSYLGLNMAHGFRHLPAGKGWRLLGIGSAYGDELLPLLDRCAEVVIVEPAEGFAGTSLKGVPVRYVKPDPSGRLPFEDGAFDAVVCFSVLHHVPNVSTVIGELYRCLRPGGYTLLREPTISMGDWRQPRRGLTRRERGLPLALFRSIVTGAGFEVHRETRCMFSLTSRLRPFLRGPVFNVPCLVTLDALICRLPVWRARYHPRHALDKLRPTAVAFVLRKPAGSPV